MRIFLQWSSRYIIYQPHQIEQGNLSELQGEDLSSSSEKATR